MSGARLLLTVDEFLGTRYPELLAGESLPALAGTVLLAGTHASARSWCEFVATGPDTPASPETAVMVGPRDLADIMFTSGTTGSPKGVMSTHGQNVRVYITWADTVGLRTGDRYLAVNPFFHTFGYKAGWLASLIRGATIYPVPVFDAATVLAKIARDRVTVLPGPPTIYQSLLAHEARERSDLSSLRLAVTGAANVPPILIRRMREELGFESVVTAYGLTESTGTVTQFTNYLEPNACSREVFSFHRPEELKRLVELPAQVRARLKEMPPLDETKLWGVQAVAIRELEKSLAANRVAPQRFAAHRSPLRRTRPATYTPGMLTI
jgi:acyl-CoA synthetase (AMP-forming)/AMP-acid ligase II